MTSTTGGEFPGTERFQVVRRLQAGGIGVVYEAHDRQRDTRVALKTLLHMSPTALYRFKQEFRSLAEIVHPNLVPLYELISDGGQWFFTMELIDGTNFLAYLRGLAVDVGETTLATAPGGSSGGLLSGGIITDLSTLAEEKGSAESVEAMESTLLASTATGAWTPRRGDDGGEAAVVPRASPPEASMAVADSRRLRQAFRQVAEGTDALHRAGKLHRDIKPGNILVRPDGRVVLLDFGLVYPLALAPHAGSSGADGDDSSRASRWADLSDHGMVAGTVAYMSPEQAAAKPLTPASDWYALGVMLYQALTGRLPFSGLPLQVLRSKQALDGPAPAALVPGVPKDLDLLCVRLLRRDPTDRPSGPDVLAILAGDEDQADAAPLPAEVPAFIGREGHLDGLRRAFGQVRDGRAAVCSVHGRSGAGKSALVQHFLDEVAGRGEAVILTGRCYEQESVPYKAVDSLVDALTRFLLHLDREEVAALLPPHVAALTRIFPVLTRIEAVAEATRGVAEISDLRQQRSRAFAALRELLARISARWPLIAWVDDLHWGDVDGAALLSYVLTPPGGPKLLLLLTYRSESIGVSPCLRALKIPTGAEDSPTQTTLVVEALNPDETLELARVLLDSGPAGGSQADWVARESGGSAFFVHELVRHLRAGLATAPVEGVDLDKILWARVLGLSPEGRRLLEVVAVASRPVRLRIAQEVAGYGSLPPHLISLLRSGHLIRTTGPHLDDEIETYHDRVRESVVAHLGGQARQATHAGLAAALEAAGDADPETLASHFEAAGMPTEASRHYTVAAAKAVGLLAFERAEELYKKAADLAPTDRDRAAAYEQMVHFYTNMARFEEAYAVGRQGAALMGLRLPERFRLPAFLLDYVRSRLRLRGRRVGDLLQLPDMADPRREAAVRIISAMLKAAYQVQPELNVALSTKGINLCLEHGNTPHCAICYMAYGTIFQGGVLGRHEVGHEFGQLSLSLVEKYGNADQRGEVNFVVGYFATSWMRPSTEAEAIWQVAHQAASTARCGGYDGAADLFNIGNSSVGTIMSQHMRGLPMDEVWHESGKYLETLRRANLREQAGVITCVRQFVLNMRGQTSGRSAFGDAEFDEDEFVGRLAGFGCRHFGHFYHILKTQALYLWGEYDAALEAARASAGYLNDSRGMLHWAEHHFYDALVLAAVHDRLGPLRRRKSLRAVRRTHRMFQGWAGRCAHNFLPKERLLAAEVHRLRGRHAEALAAYDESAAVAQKYGYVQIQALARERAARLCQAMGDPSAARSNLTASGELYRLWGASAYADALHAELGGPSGDGTEFGSMTV